MGIESDQEIAQLVGVDPQYLNQMSLSLLESSQEGVLTQEQALDYIGERINSKIKRDGYSFSKSKRDEAFDILKDVVLVHVEVKDNSLFSKCRYIALMIRRIIEAKEDPSTIDDKDYYGNKRLELAGQLISLLFEDTFKRFQKELEFKFNKELK
jgi:DNA-directed RNA polymerase III subunit RPC2